MTSYLNAKFLLFKEILKKKSTIISDKKIPQFKFIKKIAEKINFKLLDINSEFEKIKKFTKRFDSDFKIKNLSMAIKAT